MALLGALTLNSGLTWGQDDPQTSVVNLDRWDVVETLSRPHGVGGAEHTGTSKHAVHARYRSLRIQCSPAGIRSRPVLAPLPHIPRSVIQTPRVG